MTTGTTRTRSHRWLGWTIVTVVLLVAGIAGAALAGAGTWSPRSALDPDSAGPQGARALARTLTAHGVPVTPTRSLSDAHTEGTLVVGDTTPLSDDQVVTLAGAGRDVVFLAPTSRDIRVLFSGASSGYGSGVPRAAGCGFAAAERAGAVTVGTLFDADNATWSCYPDDHGFGLLAVERDGGILSALDAGALFANDTIARDGNAALGLALLGRTGAVTWYTPGLADAAGRPATLGTLTPGWVTPALLVLVAAAGAAALWRGRRFGPLVAERLPVTVRGDETTRGRGRLYAASRDTAHVGQLLRDAARHRLGRALGLPPDADAGTVADALAARHGAGLGVDPHDALLGPLPRTDAELVRLSDELDRWEAQVGTRHGAEHARAPRLDGAHEPRSHVENDTRRSTR